ncbi:ABC transporter ATP-binding protein [Psychromicrobium xiongbiense]|uniref:ABC transporter ATP-binding protein n=1 Tax=Psychromicrobium xiongbiense TaxID=3051184 RepID=UPI002552E87F|nr:ABC transporter ATP-binding protein [Psychromicrobium sp. YIM S02556]
MAEPLIELTGLAKTYPGAVPVHALLPTDLALQRGDYLAIVGPSGSGKSTLLNMLGLLDTATAGSYRLMGVELADAPDHLRGMARGHAFGFVFQAFHLLPGRTVVENIELSMMYVRVPPKRRRQRAFDSLEFLGLGHRAFADPRELSGGERQRAAIARAIAAEPDVLFCDEPTGNLDTANSARVMELLDTLNGEGITVVLVTHDHDLAARAGRQLTVRDGLVTEDARDGLSPAVGH